MHKRIAARLAERFHKTYEQTSLREAKKQLRNLVPNEIDQALVLKEWEKITDGHARA